MDLIGPQTFFRIIELIELERTFRGHLVQLTCTEQGHLQLVQNQTTILPWKHSVLHDVLSPEMDFYSFSCHLEVFCSS